MYSFVCKRFINLCSSARSLRSSSLISYEFYGTKSVVEFESSEEPFIASYLVNKCGFSPEKALSASNYLKFESPEKPDSVISFLRNHGFAEKQISMIVQKDPKVLSCDPENTLSPKIEFFRKLGFSVEDYTRVICGAPTVFRTSLEKQILPAVEFLERHVLCREKVRACVRRNPWVLFRSFRALMEDNIEFLRGLGVDESSIAYYVYSQPKLFKKDRDRFRTVLEEVKGLGFEPSRRSFVAAATVFFSLSKSSWEKKVCVFKKWGLTEDEILERFVKNPKFMSYSEEKITAALDFIVNEMGFEPPDVLKFPSFIGYSLKTRIIPRSLVYQALCDEGLLPKNPSRLYHILRGSDDNFFKNYVELYSKQVPQLQELYRRQHC